MSVLSDIVAKFRKGSPNIAAAFDEVERRLILLETPEPPPPPPPPPPTGVLRWKPPESAAWEPTIRVTGPGPINLQSGKDYKLDIDAAWSSGSGRTSIQINGGRHVVAVGGRVQFTQTNANDDQTCIHRVGGDVGGITHLEGLHLVGVNGITLSTKQTVQVEACRIEVDTQGFPGPHPDIIQVWQGGPAALRIHRLSGRSDYTGLSCLEPPDPTRWEMHEVDIRGLVVDGLMKMAAVQYHNSGGTPPAGPFTTYVGSDLWVETGFVNASVRRKLDDVLVLKYLAGQQGNTSLVAWPYEIHPGPGQSGTKYTSPNPATGGNAPYPLGTRQGDRLTFERVPEFVGHSWTFGKPPVGEYVPAGTVGPNYVPLGYL